MKLPIGIPVKLTDHAKKQLPHVGKTGLLIGIVDKFKTSVRSHGKKQTVHSQVYVLCTQRKIRILKGKMVPYLDHSVAPFAAIWWEPDVPLQSANHTNS